VGFIVRVDGKGLRGVLVCDAPGCGREIDFVAAARSSTVAMPPHDIEPSPILFACGRTCEHALLAAAGEGAGAIDLATWWESTTSVLGFDDDDDDEISVPTPTELAAMLEKLDHVLARAGLSVGLSVRQAMTEPITTETQAPCVVLRPNNCVSNDPCAICGARTDPVGGLDFMLAGTNALVCDRCADAYACGGNWPEWGATALAPELARDH
jgi:hypothetical protein